MTSDTNNKRENEPIPTPTWKPRPPEMDLEPVQAPEPTDSAPLGDGAHHHSGGVVPAIPSRDEANVNPDEPLPEDVEEEILSEDPGRENTRFDEEMPKTSR